MDEGKKKLIEHYTNILNAIQSDDYPKLKELSKQDAMNKTLQELRHIIPSIEENYLRKLFKEYLSALSNDQLNKILEKYNYEKVYSLEKDIRKYLSKYGTDLDKENYVSIRFQNRKIDIRAKQYAEFKHEEDMKRLLQDDSTNYFDELYSKNITPNTLNNWYERYCMLYIPEKQKKIELLRKIELYQHFYENKSLKRRKEYNGQQKIARQQRIILEILPEAKKLIEDLISSKKSRSLYCESNKISSTKIRENLKLIEEYDKKSYELYINQILQNEANENKNNAVLALQMESMIKNGIEEDGYTREFDIVDYYMITKRIPREFIKSAEEGLGSAVKISELKRLLNKVYTNVSPLKLDENEILNNKVLVSVDGQEREITQEEKKNMLKFLKDNDIPQTEYTYRIMQLRLINKLTGRNIKKRTYS